MTCREHAIMQGELQTLRATVAAIYRALEVHGVVRASIIDAVRELARQRDEARAAVFERVWVTDGGESLLVDIGSRKVMCRVQHDGIEWVVEDLTHDDTARLRGEIERARAVAEVMVGGGAV